MDFIIDFIMIFYKTHNGNPTFVPSDLQSDGF